MKYEDAILFLKKYAYFHDSIVDQYVISNSTFVDEKGSIVFEKNGWNSVQIFLSSQNDYKVQIDLKGVRKMVIHEFYDDIIFKVALKKDGEKILFSITGGFGTNHTWFQADEIEFCEIS